MCNTSLAVMALEVAAQIVRVSILARNFARDDPTVAQTEGNRSNAAVAGRTEGTRTLGTGMGSVGTAMSVQPLRRFADHTAEAQEQVGTSVHVEVIEVYFQPLLVRVAGAQAQ